MKNLSLKELQDKKSYDSILDLVEGQEDLFRLT